MKFRLSQIAAVVVLASVGVWLVSGKIPVSGAPGSGHPKRKPVSLSTPSPLSAPPRVSVSSQAQSAETLAKLKLLDQILESRDDNDPRLDREFNSLSNEEKDLMMARYLRTAPERRNERGTIVYLLGRNLTRTEDFQFLQSVLSEEPCLSLSDCSRANSSADDPHGDSAADVTLAYPQLVMLKSIEKFLSQTARGGIAATLRTRALQTLQQGSSSKVPRVAETAEEILRNLGKGP